MTKQENKSKKSTNIFSWRPSNEELKSQVENYSELKITQSYRGISVLIALALLGLSVLLGLFGIAPLQDTLYTLYGLILYIPIVFFVYRGHRWAIITLMLLWTLEKGSQLIEVKNIMPLIWWAIVIPYFYKALKVENERKKLAKSKLPDIQGEKKPSIKS